MIYKLLRPLLFALEPELSHKLALILLAVAYKIKILPNTTNTINAAKTVMGIKFPNPIGLAAGLDKNGKYLAPLAALGFGFIEIGTVTPQPQAGNLPPRLFRLPQVAGIINRMGFNNDGVERIFLRLLQSNFNADIILGINIGKNSSTPLAQAALDYQYCLQRLYRFADYFTINISSPNSPGLRDLQHEQRQFLVDILTKVKQTQAKLADKYGNYVPIAVKIAPDLSEEQLYALLDILVAEHIDGVIAVNTTIDKSMLAGQRFANEEGGLSGAPLKSLAERMLLAISKHLAGQLPIISVGGVSSANDLQRRLRFGADLVQIYSALIYKGPGLIIDILRSCS